MTDSIDSASSTITPPFPTAESETNLGKAAMDVRDVESAIEHFGRALKLAIDSYGDGVEDHPSTAPFYARYGKALLEAAVRAASLSLVNEEAVDQSYGGAVEGIEHGKLIELSDDEDAPEVEVEGEEESNSEDVPDEQEEEEGDYDNDDDDEEVEMDEDDDKEADDNDFDLAWQMLDTARLLYSRQEGTEARVLEATVLEDLADLGMETETFQQAIGDYQLAIVVLGRVSHSPGNIRALASLHFKLGMALEYSGRVPDAIKALEDAHSLIVGLSTAAMDPAMKGKEKMVVEAVVESDELDAIVKEIEVKLEELRSGKTLGAQGNITEAMHQAVSTSTTPSQQQPVHDLTGLVKKRRVA